MKPKKLRLSYSLLAAWGRGNIEQAVDTYFRLGMKQTPQIEYGIKFHEDMAKHIETFNSFDPRLNFNMQLKLPETEKFHVAEYNEYFDIGGVFDCYDTGSLFEFKTGIQPSSDWAKTEQLPLYFLIAELEKIQIDTAYVIRYDQYHDNADFSIVHNSKKKRDEARNIIDSYGYEIWDYFNKHGLLIEKPIRNPNVIDS